MFLKKKKKGINVHHFALLQKIVASLVTLVISKESIFYNHSIYKFLRRI